MEFELPKYRRPDFALEALANAPDARWEPAERDGVAPDGYHSTSMYPEYVKIDGAWRLAEESRMDSSVVLRPDGRLDVVENRNLRRGDAFQIRRKLCQAWHVFAASSTAAASASSRFDSSGAAPRASFLRSMASRAR